MVTCPKGHKMLIRNGRYGKFYGCSEYPDCRETRPFNTKSKSKKNKSKSNIPKKICSECGYKKVRVYQRGDSICDNCKTKFTKKETQLLMDFKPIKIKSEKVPEIKGNMSGSVGTEEFELMGPLLTYYEMCSRGTRRIGGMTNVYENVTKGKEVLDEVAHKDILELKDYSFSKESNKLIGLYRETQVDPETNPLQLGSLWVMGSETENNFENKGKKRICAPLLIYDLEIDYESGNTCIVNFEEIIPTLNYPLVEYLADIKGISDGGVAFAFENLLNLLPELPIDISKVNEFLKSLKGFLPSQKIDIKTMTDFEDFIFENPFESELKVVNTFAIFNGADMSPLTVVKEIEALREVDSFEDSALLNALLPIQETGNELFEVDKFEGNTNQLEEEFTHNFEFLPLSDTQREIIKSTRSRPMTLVTGPPGTGKSHTITAVILDYVVSGRKTLLTSNTRKAVEVVVEKLEELCGPFIVAMSGGRKQQNDLAKKLDDLINPGTLDDAPTVEELSKMEEEYLEKLENLQIKSNELEEKLSQLTRWSINHNFTKDYMSSDFEIPKNLEENTYKLRKKIEKAKSKTSDNVISKNLQRRLIISVAKSLDIDSVKVKNLEEAVNYLESIQENKDLQQELTYPVNSKVSALWNKVSKIDNDLRDLATAYLTGRRKLELKSLLSNPKNNREIANFRNALRRADNVAKKEILEDISYELLLDLFPCWASTDNFLSHILPLKPRMFHLSIIDEASYCRVDSAIPTLYRARKGLIVGDPNQLKPVMFLSKSLNNAAIAKSKMNKASTVTYNFKRPLFDIVSENLDLNAKFMLDEHFRSEQEIIKFSSDKFYNSKLSLMTQKPRFEEDIVANQINFPINVHYVDGKRKFKTGPNEFEATKAIEVAKKIIKRNPEWTVGILTPFRSQANFGTSMLSKNFTNNELIKSKLIFDTAHQLQGDERDAIIISFTLDKDFLTNQLNWMQEETGVFNVSITRARKELHIVSSLQPTQLPKGLLKEFLEYAEDSLVPAPLSSEYDSKFEEDVAIRLVDQKIKIIPQFPAAGYLIDLVASKHGEFIGIECDGPSHFDSEGNRTERDLERHMKLQRAGWNLHRISYIDWEKDSNNEIKKILDLFSHKDIIKDKNLDNVRNIINEIRDS